jgi:hypothetical protein
MAIRDLPVIVLWLVKETEPADDAVAENVPVTKNLMAEEPADDAVAENVPDAGIWTVGDPLEVRVDWLVPATFS